MLPKTFLMGFNKKGENNEKNVPAVKKKESQCSWIQEENVH